MEGGRDEFVIKDEKDEIRANRNFVKVVDRDCTVLRSPGRDSW